MIHKSLCCDVIGYVIFAFLLGFWFSSKTWRVSVVGLARGHFVAKAFRGNLEERYTGVLVDSCLTS